MSKRILNKPPKPRPRLLPIPASIVPGTVPEGRSVQRLTNPTNTVKVSVVMIVKNCADALRQCLGSVSRNFLREGDEIVVADTGSTDGKTVSVAREFKARIIDASHLKKDVRPLLKKWLPEQEAMLSQEPQYADGFLLDFAEARALVTAEAKNDIVFWIDADDELVESQPGALRSLVDRVFLDPQKRANAIFLDYLYTFDKHDGRLTTILKRERVFDRREWFWKGRCHETAITKTGRAAFFADLQSRIVHTDFRKEHTFSDMRNYIIIRNEIEEARAAGRKPDPRSVFYLANAARGLKRFGEAIELYKEHLAESGSRDDRYSAAYYSGCTYIHDTIRRPIDAMRWFFRCVEIKPDDPRGYFGLARCYFLLKRWNESLHWYKVGTLLPEPEQSLHSYDPEHINSAPLNIAILCAKELGSREMAFQLLAELKQRRPDHPETRAIEEVLRLWTAADKISEAAHVLAINDRNVQVGDNQAMVRKARDLLGQLREVPSSIEDRGLAPVEPRTETDVTIWCGTTAEAWGPQSGKAGIGGSEKMVIDLVKRIQAQGKSVAVYCKCPKDQRGVDPETGVIWRHWAEFDAAQPRKTLVVWRAVGAVEMPVPRQRTVVWCHDVQTPAEWTPARIAAVDLVVVQSEYHASTLGPVRSELEKRGKLLISRNGIDLTRFGTGVARDPNKIVYCSSPDRGVLTAIQIFKLAKQKNPDLRLHIYYGFNETYLTQAAQYEYRHIPDLAKDVNMYEYMECVHQAVDNDDDITWHGRIGFAEMARELESAAFWLYPTRFPEISCMAAMEAQVAGCHVVATRYAALAETIIDGSVIDADNPADAADAIVACSKSPSLNGGLQDEARRRFDIDTLANEWVLKVL